MGEGTSGISRRDALKRGAVLGGTVLWATPVVQTIGMTSASAQTGSPSCNLGPATSVVGTPVRGTVNPPGFLPDRNNPDSALVPGGDFFSLGFGGTIIVEFNPPYQTGAGGELVIVEITGSSGYPAETAEVAVAEDSMGPWVILGPATNTGGPGSIETVFDLDALLPPMTTVKSVRIADMSDQTDFTDDHADGFDLDGVLIRCA